MEGRKLYCYVNWKGKPVEAMTVSKFAKVTGQDKKNIYNYTTRTSRVTGEPYLDTVKDEDGPIMVVLNDKAQAFIDKCNE